MAGRLPVFIMGISQITGGSIWHHCVWKMKKTESSIHLFINGRTIPPAEKDPEHIISTWKKIWEGEDQGSIAREYSFDMEEYSPDGTVRIRIALK